MLSNRSITIESKMEQVDDKESNVSKGGYGNTDIGKTNDAESFSSTIGTIVLMKKLGSGHFGDVWKAKKGEKIIAIKLLQKSTQSALNEMLEEVSLLG
jgi:hypothetical protein